MSTFQPNHLRTISQQRRLQVGVILLGGTTEILDIAPVDVLTAMSKDAISIFPPEVVAEELKKQAVAVDMHYVNESGKPARVTSGMSLNVTDTFQSCPPLDIALIGATIDNPSYTPTETELTFLRTLYAQPTLHSFLTICAGMLPVLQAGLLQGKRATAPRVMVGQLKNAAGGVEWSERRWEVNYDSDGTGHSSSYNVGETDVVGDVHGGRPHGPGKQLWSSGTLLNGTDMMREWAGRNFGRDPAKDLMGCVLDFGGWPGRDVEYRDEDAAAAAKLGGVNGKMDAGLKMGANGMEVEVK